MEDSQKVDRSYLLQWPLTLSTGRREQATFPPDPGRPGIRRCISDAESVDYILGLLDLSSSVLLIPPGRHGTGEAIAARGRQAIDLLLLRSVVFLHDYRRCCGLAYNWTFQTLHHYRRVWPAHVSCNYIWIPRLDCRIRFCVISRG